MKYDHIHKVNPIAVTISMIRKKTKQNKTTDQEKNKQNNKNKQKQNHAFEQCKKLQLYYYPL